MLLGHRHPAVEAAIERQLRVAPALSLMHDLEIEVAERLTEMIPCAERVAFGKNGSDVTLAAVRVARAVTGREVVVACGYHGFHDWCMAQYAWCAGVPSVLRESLRTFPYNDVEALKRVLESERGRVAAVILEPTANDLPLPGYLESVKQLAHEHGAILVFDEIVTGFRLARGGAQEAYGVVPDLATFGKALANGMPLSALVGREEVMAALPRVGFGLTFRGELLSLAAAAACLTIFAREPVAEQVMRTGEFMRARFTEMARVRGVPVVLQGFGGRMSFTFEAASGISPIGWRTLWVQECLREGVLTNGMLMPCYAHDAAAVELTLAALDRALASVQTVTAAGVLEPFLDVPVTAAHYEV
jgi:glutamate-1-semialdehyde aminotransferase